MSKHLDSIWCKQPPIPCTKRSRNCIGTMAGGKFRFAIDRGGTFTDVYSECPNGEVKVMKLLSVDPAYPDAPKEGIRRILQEVSYSPSVHRFTSPWGKVSVIPDFFATVLVKILIS